MEEIQPTLVPQAPAPQATMPAQPKPSIFAGTTPKLAFIMGLVAGVAAVSLVGFVLAGSYALSVKGGGSVASNLANTNQPAPSNQPNQPSGPPTKVDIKVKDSDYVRGSATAPVTLITYSDLECPFCMRFHPSVLKLSNEYQGKVKFVFRHFPLPFHQNAQKEAEAAECVGKLGGADKYWKFIDRIFERTAGNGTGFALTKLGPLAREVGVSQSQFQSCLDNGDMTKKVQADIQEGSGFGVGGTPTTFVNGQTVEGAVAYEQLKAAVDQALAN